MMPKRSDLPVDPAEVRNVFSRHVNAKGMMPIVLDVTGSRGVRLRDLHTGQNFWDFFGFYATSTLGMNHPKMSTDGDFLRRLHYASLNKITNSDVQTDLMARFLRTFGRVAQPESMPFAFFISGGALAVENALKAAFDWKVRKNYAKGYQRELGHQVMHFREAFHGRSGYTLSLTNTSDPGKTMYFPRFDWPRVVNPKIMFPLEDHLEQVEKQETEALAQVKAHLHQRKDDIACIILETIQGEGGDNHFRPEFLRSLKNICLESDVLLIFDEVQCGAGITGSFWAYQQLDVEPDLIAFGKKTQVCGVLAGRRMDEVDQHVFRKPGRINSTWGGNLVDMVRFDRIMEIMEEEDLLAHTRKAGGHMLGRLQELAQRYDCASNPRGLGLMCALDISSRELRDAILSTCRLNGLIILGCGQSSIRFRPPLVITARELDAGLEVLESAISAESRKQTPSLLNTGNLEMASISGA